MRTTTVADVMNRQVRTVGPTTSLEDVIELIVDNDLRAVPVVDAHGVPLGVVSAADLPRREEPDVTAAEMMTSPAVTVAVETFLITAARMLASAGTRRLFVVDDGRLVGVLARQDMLRVYLHADEDIRAEIGRDVFGRVLHANQEMVRATVQDGVVVLTGRLEYEADVDIATRMIRSIPGVLAVRNRMDYAYTGAATHAGSMA